MQRTGATADALTGAPLLEVMLTPVRFIPHVLNKQGLHLLRVLLAERMDDARHLRERLHGARVAMRPLDQGAHAAARAAGAHAAARARRRAAAAAAVTTSSKTAA